MSVNLGRKDTQERVLARYPDNFLAALLAGEVRVLRLGITRFPLQQDPSHAYVFGKKTDSVRRKLAKVASARWIVAPPEIRDDVKAEPGAAAASLTLSLIIPAYNQRERTRRSAAKAIAFLRERYADSAELIVVDDGSRLDEAVEHADLPEGVTLVRLPKNLGKGGAVRAGVERARGEYVVFTDSELPFTLEPLETTLAWLAADADIVIGDRLHPESACAVRVGPLRRLSSAAYTFLVNHLLGLDYADTQCGYKGYRAAVAKELFGRLQVTSFAFDAELLLRAQKSGYRVRRQPLKLVHDEDSSVRLAHHAPRMLVDVAWLAWRSRTRSL